MEESTNPTFFTFDSPKGQSSYIKVIGVGGGGGNAVNHMFERGIVGVDFIVCNTDMKALNASPVPNKIPLGDLGLGAGNKPEKARKAAYDKADDIRDAISHNTQMLFITAGMGGGTGTGAAPVIAEIAKSIDLDNDENHKILVVAIVTRPFSFEGRRRREQAEAGIAELSKHVDAIIVINNDKLRSFGDLRISEAFGMADDVLLTAVKGIAEIITENAYVNRDFQDVNTVMERSGTALMGTGSGRGENRAHDAIAAATTSVLLDDPDIRGAKNVLLYFTYSTEHEMTMDEQSEITDYVLDKTDGTADIIWGAGPDENLGDELKVILIATGFEKKAESVPVVTVLETNKKEDEPVAQKPQPDEDGFVVTQRQSLDQPESAVVKDEPSVDKPAVETDAIVEETPTSKEKNIIKLDDDWYAESEPVAEPASNAPTMEEQSDVMVDDIHLVSQEAEPVNQQVVEQPEMVKTPVEQSQPFRSAFMSDNDATTAADRIRRIHDLLCSHPNGADIVQKMSMETVGDRMLFEGRSSAVRESSSTTMRADGTLVQNPWFRDQPD